ncbi:MAG TPA: TerB N-terminal domain-containing protein, partial [Nitrococcus sp.]|nr:TerB N-terminal domain-containing protein [Nitrococcus sp.]
MFASISREVGIGLGVIGLIAAAIYYYGRSKSAPRPPEPTLSELMESSSKAISCGGAARARVRVSSDDMPEFRAALSRRKAASPSSGGFKIPKAPGGYGKARWIAPGETIEVAGTRLPGGLFYVGTTLRAPSGYSDDPCLINPRNNVAKHGDFTVGQMGYWPSYGDISASARRAYLNWLAAGRRHPACNIGFVFLFFYGLERRVIIDSQNDPTAQRDWGAIIAEIRRLLSIYGERSGSFRRYAAGLLDWMSLKAPAERLYEQPVPDFLETYELPSYLRFALGQAAVDRVPVPAPLALAWVHRNPSIALRTAAKRCSEEFDRLFIERYHEILGPGLLLPKNRTRLKCVYRPASASLHGTGALIKTFGNLPDVTVLTAPVKRLQEIVNLCIDDLGAFSRLIGKAPGARNTLDGLL